jgi:hypothetical protein
MTHVHKEGIFFFSKFLLYIFFGLLIGKEECKIYSGLINHIT